MSISICESLMDAFSAQITALIEIANLAMVADEMERIAAQEKADLRTAYEDFKARNGGIRITIDTPEWERMMQVTKGEYAASEAAKRRAYNAKRRLRATIARHRAKSLIGGAA